jgi:hypothetical protein
MKLEPHAASPAVTTVPAWLRGLWRRRSIAWPDGRLDDTTVVYWLQTASAFADIRIPAGRPGLGDVASPFSDAQVRWLARQGGFAGWAELHGDRCRWHRQIDFQPPTGLPDEGRLRWQDGVLIEEGVHEPYVEVWERVAVGTNAVRVARAAGEREMLVVCGDIFLFARARRTPLPPADSLETLVRAAAGGPAIAALLDCEISFGTCAGGAAGWEIRLSTIPARLGCRLDDAPSGRG